LAVLIALPVGLASQTALKEVPYVAMSGLVLLLIIGIGVVFDVVGVAATAASEAPLHARASRGVFGARRAVRLVRNAHMVASFCNDVVGDVSGTLSGAIAMAIVVQLVATGSVWTVVTGSTIMSALVAGLIVGGKAYGKVFAIRHSTDIMFAAGRCVEIACRPFSWLGRGRRSGRR
jgi:CBS domain containing-hemolysin-like protein